jgi:hypothetical protein
MSKLLQSNRICSLAGNIANIVPQYCNFDRQIAQSNLQPTRTNCKLKFTKDLWTKLSDWTISKKEANQIVWATGYRSFPFSYSSFRGLVYKSFVNFNLQFVRFGCKLLRSISLSKLQYCGTISQCCSQENIRFDCKLVQIYQYDKFAAHFEIINRINHKTTSIRQEF